ncbi:MFS transporter [Candidatus Chlorohelix sp.]|uniref:MFS transporter n=1 Tax=Candidatus Chlorohelix sp. TaxID=3139201 RepID=UPI0030373275
MQVTNKHKPVTSAESENQAVMRFPDGRPINPWLVLVSLVMGLFMALLDGTIVNIAYNAISTELKSDTITTSWVLNAYNLVFAVLLVTMGRLADQFGRKRVFMSGMVLFTIGSLLCAVAPSIEWLIGFRAVQGIGAAALNPISLAIITIVFPPEKRGAAIGIWGAITGMAMALGPIIGGFLVDNYDWRSIFFVNIPVCIVALFMVWRNVPENRDPNTSSAIDLPGMILLSVSLLCLVLAIINGNSWGWGSAGIIGMFVGSVLAMALFIIVELKEKHPIIDFSLFRIRSFIASNFAMFLFGIGIQAGMLMLVLYFITSRGYNELEAAYALLPMPIAGFITSGVFGMFSRKANLRYVAMGGLIVSGVGLLSFFSLDYNSEYIQVIWRGVLVGIGLGTSFMTFSNIVLSEVPHSKAGVGSGVFNTFRQIGFALGVAIMISFFAGQVKDNMVDAKARVVEIIRSDATIPEIARTMIVQQFDKMGAQGGASMQSGKSQAFDLVTMSKGMPGMEAIQPQLAVLNTKIGNEFNKASVDAFRYTWLLGGIFILLGVIPASFARHLKNAKPEASSGA